MNAPRRAAYEASIRRALAHMGLPDTHDPRHIEAWMRVGHGTLDGLSPGQFRKEVRLAVSCLTRVGAAESEALATSYGM